MRRSRWLSWGGVVVLAVVTGACGGGGEADHEDDREGNAVTGPTAAVPATTSPTPAPSATPAPPGDPTPAPSGGTTATAIAYEPDVRPVLAADCVRCHSEMGKYGEHLDRRLDRDGQGREGLAGVLAHHLLQAFEAELLYVGLRRRDLADGVYEIFVGLCSTVLPVTLADTDRAKDLVRDGAEASVRDAVQASAMLNNDLRLIATFDSGFDRIPGVERVTLD
jgi:predicted nucleic acid-binding protein